MEFLLNRYRNLAVLLAAILVQLALLAYQVKSAQEVRLIRVWSVGAVMPVARVIEAGRTGVSHFFRNYFLLLGVREERDRLKADLNRAEMENQYYRAELATADRASALKIFQISSQSKTVAAHVIANTTDTGANAVIDRGSSDGVQKGLAVITPEGIVGKVISVFPNFSIVLLITDPTFAAGVVSQKHHVHGTLKGGQGISAVTVEYVQNEETVDQGEWFIASGEDGIFPRGIPVGQANIVRQGRSHKEIFVTPSGLQNGLEDVLIVIDGVHGTIPNTPPPDQPVHLLPPPGPDESNAGAPAQSGAHLTELDRAAQSTRAIGEAQHHVFGDKNTPAPNYNLALPAPASPSQAGPSQTGPNGSEDAAHPAAPPPHP
jgi:rod shape-determining protein MreC